MPVKSSGTLSFATDIVGEFEDTTPHKLSEFYRGGDKVPDAGINANVPTSSEIKFSDFYGATNVIEVSITSNSYIHPTTGSTVSLPMGTTLNLYNLASVFSAPASGAIEVPFVFTIDYNTIFNNSIIAGGEFSDLTIYNYGVICGRGGHGRQNNEIGGVSAGSKSNIGNGVTANYGNAAIFIDYDVDLFSLVNYSNAFIAGGGNSTFSANTTKNDLNNKKSAIGRTAIWSARAYSGDGGGWNGGVGGNARANASASFTSTWDPHENNSDFSGDTTSQTNSLSRIVTSRSVNGTTGHSGSRVRSGLAWAYESSYSSTSWHPVAQNASYGSGGSGLNGGTHGGPGNIAGDHHGTSSENRAAAARSAAGSGGGGGNGIGSGSGPTNVGSSGRGASAGAGYSLQISTAATVTTGSFVNGGRRYGSSSITVSAP